MARRCWAARPRMATGPGAYDGGTVEGPHGLTATATDAAGNSGVASAALRVTVDTAAPAAPTHWLVLDRQRCGGRSHHQRQHAGANRHGRSQRTVKVFDGTTQIGSATANGSGAWTYTTAALANGAHSLTATATDAAGNTSAASASI